METKAITIHVNRDVAQAYEAVTTEQRKFDAILSLKLAEITKATRPLETIMHEVSQQAQEMGLTPEILESMLNDTGRLT